MMQCNTRYKNSTYLHDKTLRHIIKHKFNASQEQFLKGTNV